MWKCRFFSTLSSRQTNFSDFISNNAKIKTNNTKFYLNPNSIDLINPTSISELLSTTIALQLNKSNITSSSLGIIIASCPHQGSENTIYNILHEKFPSIVSFSNADIFPVVSGSQVKSFMSKSTVKSNFISHRNGRKKPFVHLNPSLKNSIHESNPGLMIYNLMDSVKENNEPIDDLNVPYPWFQGYNDLGSQKKMVIDHEVLDKEAFTDMQKMLFDSYTEFFNRLDGKNKGLIESNQNELIPLDKTKNELTQLNQPNSDQMDKIIDSNTSILFYSDFFKITSNLKDEMSPKDVFKAFQTAYSNYKKTNKNTIIVLPFTPNSSSHHQTTKENPLANFLASTNNSDLLNVSNNGKKTKEISYSTPFDNHLGVSIVNIVPRNDPLSLKLFRKMVNDDRYRSFAIENLRHVNIVLEESGFNHLDYDQWMKVLKEVSKSFVSGHSILFTKEINVLESERIVMFAIAHSNQINNQTNNSTLSTLSTLSTESMIHACKLFSNSSHLTETTKMGLENAFAFKSNPSLINTLSKHEKNIMKQCLYNPESNLGIFSTVGGLEKTKRTIDELIKLPLKRPELFQRGILSRSTTGILLFGPPGTGKTMLAKSVATESGANFLSVQMSHISSMWVGENEKNVKALFSLARKLKPCVIFIDEMDALLRARQASQPSYATNTINEFMQEWDGVQSENDGIIVVGASNRPFDLDEAVLRRLPRRILVDLPDSIEKQSILELLLFDERIESVEERRLIISELVNKTEYFSGSDLKNLCIAAALNCLRENIDTIEINEDKEMNQGITNEVIEDGEEFIDTRPLLKIKHFREALDSGDIVPSINEKTELLKQLKQWNQIYGGGKRIMDQWGFKHV